MRAVVAVLLFVSAAHAGLWSILQDKQQAPDFSGILPSVSYTPFEPGHVVAGPAQLAPILQSSVSKTPDSCRMGHRYSGLYSCPDIADPRQWASDNQLL